jgi:hypothetical protein
MVEKRIKPALLVLAAATASLSCLALPTVRTVVAALPESRSGSTSCSGLRDIARRSHAEFGDLAAEVACTYLRKFGASQSAVVPVRESLTRSPGSQAQISGSEKRRDL